MFVLKSSLCKIVHVVKSRETNVIAFLACHKKIILDKNCDEYKTNRIKSIHLLKFAKICKIHKNKRISKH